MSNKKIFASASVSVSNRKAPKADTINEAGGIAYQMTDKHALAQYALTGCLNDAFYVSGEVQLDTILELSKKVSDKFLAQLAVYARKNGLMKDTPALLCAILANRDVELLKSVFPVVLDNGKMLRNFVQIIRSGTTGRTSFGTSIKTLIQKWLDARSDAALFKDSVGNDPSIADVIKMAHPAPANRKREALYGYLIGKKAVSTKTLMEKNEKGRATTVLIKDLPDIVQEFEKYKANVLAGKDAGTPPDVDFQMLTALNLGKNEWTEIARNAPWMMTRMNLNSFMRHEVFTDSKMINIVANRLRDAEQIRKSRCFPYQLLCAYKNTESVPAEISNALQDALEIATENVPTLEGKSVAVLVDTSGSMSGASITGNRGSATSSVTCVDVAGLIASSILRVNPNSEVVLFDTQAYNVKLNPRDSVMTNAQKCARGGGGTDVSCGIRYLNQNRKSPDVVLIVSDNESWVSMSGGRSYGGGTDAQSEWETLKKRNKNAKIICIDLAANATSQVQSRKDCLNIGGFSDTVWKTIHSFVVGEKGTDQWVDEIEKVKLG